LLAKTMRVCAYDRAGYGFSDPGPLPRNLDAEVADLHALVHAADIDMPAIFVGHSIGSNIVRRYDQLHAGDVAALVLIDPPPQDVAAFSPTYAKVEAQMAPAMLQAYRACGQAAKEGKLAADPLPPELRSCLRPPSPAYSERLNAALRTYKSSPAFWDTILSASEAKIGLFDAPVPPDEKHGNKPLIVLTALDAYAGAAADDRKALEAAQKRTHEALAASSKAGRRIDVPHASHELQSDDPQAVLDAVRSAEQRLSKP
jgi:pimeloyl-ACP methyl ester carboxylesterase